MRDGHSESHPVWSRGAMGLHATLRRRAAAWSRNERTLVLTLALFTAITSAQFVGAALAGSLSLLVDAGSMLVDVCTYAANLWAECAQHASRRRAALVELAVSGLSLCALWAIMIAGVAQSAQVLARLGGAGGQAADGGSVDARVVLGFALVGLLIDGVVLAQFARGHDGRERRSGQSDQPEGGPEEGARGAGRRRAGGDAGEPAGADVGGPSAGGAPGLLELSPSRVSVLLAEAAAEHAGTAPPEGTPAGLADGAAAGGGIAGARPGGRRGCARCVCGSGHRLNMSSALSHVLADLFRSATTLAEAALILRGDVDGQLADAVAALLVAAAIALTSWGTTVRWCVHARELLAGRAGGASAKGPALLSPTEPLHATGLAQPAAAPRAEAEGAAGGAAAASRPPPPETDD